MNIKTKITLLTTEFKIKTSNEKYLRIKVY